MKSKKAEKLKKSLKDMKKVVLAFSGGLDSTFLLKMALNAIGRDNVLAVTAKSDSFPGREYKHAKELAKTLNASFITINTKETKNEKYLKNPVNRCYYCKKELFGKLISIAKKRGFYAVVDGFNYDDRKDMRYGSQAAKELGVRSPLAEARIGKQEIRRFSRQLKLSTWNKPSFACLASRFPYHHRITKKKLHKINKAEEFLYKQGFEQVRVRVHDNIARIEITNNGIKRLSRDKDLRKKIVNKLKQSGFSYVTLDLVGYRTGSMNEVLTTDSSRKGRMR